MDAAMGPDLDELVLLKTIQLRGLMGKETSSQVNEPSVASHDDVVFYTGNWYAAVSLDAGSTFQFVDPFTSFPDPPGMQFCCDQVVHYISQIDTFVWLLQYGEDDDGGNIQRLAFARTEDVAAGRWRLFDIRPENLGMANHFLDFPDIAVGANMLYVTTNAFEGEDWRATALLRFPLQGIESGSVTAQSVISTTNFNFRVAQHCGERAFWASHRNTSTLRVFSWDEAASQPVFRDVQVASWTDGPYMSRTPDNRNWLGRADRRIVGATRADGQLWFAWGSNSGGANNRPQPFVQIARLQEETFQVLENINLWHPDSAIFYAALSTNSRGEVGVSYMIGGGPRFPTHVVGILTNDRRETVAVTGQRGPAGHRWGDYLTVRRHSPDDRLFTATGYTLENGNGTNDAMPHFVLFGRARDTQ